MHSWDAGTFEEEGIILQDRDHVMRAESKCPDFTDLAGSQTLGSTVPRKSASGLFVQTSRESLI